MIKSTSNTTGISIYPNPVTNGFINLQLESQPAGEYKIRLLNSFGTVIISKSIKHGGNGNTEKIQWNKKSPKGIYELEITRPDGIVQVISIMN